ncbi:MAG: hypothetical protein U9Q70_07190 [Chloroflexota bacterium]|nr:hypothetical protein [Chloroflexota bacterium]
MLLSNLTPFQERWFWLGVSMALAVLAAWIKWLLLPITGEQVTWRQRWQRWAGRPWVRELARLSYYLGLPAVVLLWRGALTERGLGLQSLPTAAHTVANGTDWMRDLGWAGGMGLVAAAIVFLSRRQIMRLRPTQPTRRRDMGVAFREASCQESHWAFYRAPFVLLWGTEIGSWAGLLPLLIENILSPLTWEELATPGRGRDLWLNVTLLITSTLLYLQTQNFWCALLVDVALRWLWGYKSTAPE